MPLHVIEVILARAERRGLLVHWRDTKIKATKYKLTNAGILYSANLETNTEVERRINSLIESIRQFLKEKGLSLNFNEVSDLLNRFIQKNIDTLIECINPSSRFATSIDQEGVGYDRQLFNYIITAEHQKPNEYKTLENMVLGSIISVLLYVDNPSEITEIRTKEFKDCQIYLDTNYVFSLLGFDVKEFTEPAEELFNLLKKQKFKTKVFDFTINEICKVINTYYSESYKYPKTIRVSSIYTSLKLKGWTKTQAREFIINIEQILQNKGITIEWTKEINLDRYTPDERSKNFIEIYKPNQAVFHRNHDLAAIAKIKEIRGKPVRRIEESKAIFLSSDYKLHKFNFIEEGHKKNATICEVVPDRLMTNILWLKNPTSKLSLRTIIAAHSHGLFVNKLVWNRFYAILQKLKQDGKIENGHIATLFWHNYIEEVLLPIEENEANKITPAFVFDEIEKATKLREKAIEEKIKLIKRTKDEEMTKKLRRKEIELEELTKEFKKKETEFAETLEKRITDVESRKDAEWLLQINQIKESLNVTSQKEANKWSIIGISILTLTFIIAMIIAAYISIPYDLLDLFISAIGFGGIFGLWKLRNEIRDWLSKRFYTKKLEEAKLDEIQ